MPTKHHFYNVTIFYLFSEKTGKNKNNKTQTNKKQKWSMQAHPKTRVKLEIMSFVLFFIATTYRVNQQRSIKTNYL